MLKQMVSVMSQLNYIDAKGAHFLIQFHLQFHAISLFRPRVRTSQFKDVLWKENKGKSRKRTDYSKFPHKERSLVQELTSGTRQNVKVRCQNDKMSKVDTIQGNGHKCRKP